MAAAFLCGLLRTLRDTRSTLQPQLGSVPLLKASFAAGPALPPVPARARGAAAVPSPCSLPSCRAQGHSPTGRAAPASAASPGITATAGSAGLAAVTIFAAEVHPLSGRSAVLQKDAGLARQHGDAAWLQLRSWQEKGTGTHPLPGLGKAFVRNY